MDDQRFGELASRWVSAEPLAPAEEQELLDWLENHPEARRQLLDDESLDSLLRCWPRLDETADDFLRDCLARTERLVPASVKAPPVVAPPVAVTPASTLRVVAGGSPRSRKLFPAKIGRWALGVAGCAAAVLLAATGWWFLARPQRPVETGAPGPLVADNNASHLAPKGAFAVLAQSSSAVWETPLAAGDRLAAGWLKLTSGTAELDFDKGTVARLTAPAVLQLRSVDEMFLRTGSVTARVPPTAVGFTVATPLSRVVDLGTEFDVVVDDFGTTQALVRQGRVSLRSASGQEASEKPIELAAGALNQATVSVPNLAAPVLPVTTVVHGQGMFLGRMSASGKVAEFHSRPDFREFRRQALKQLHEAPDQFGQKWLALAEGAGRHGTPGGKPAENKVATKPPANPPATAAAEKDSVEVQEGGKTISITDTKESGITVTVTEVEGGKKKMTKVRAADSAELARKNPEAHQLYRKYFHPRPKAGRPK
jgi:hypothetical protein